LRPRFNNQMQFRFQLVSTLKITERYYAKYQRIDAILTAQPQLVDLIHRDVAEPLECERAPDAANEDCYKCSSETLLRIVICQILEGCSLREIVVRIDDSDFLRRFVRIHNDPMIDYSTFCRLRNRITPQTWKWVNDALAQSAAEQGQISGERTRLDTTAVETNIHWPCDSSLLGDGYRTLARLVECMRSLDPHLVDGRRLQRRKVKRLVQQIGRRSRGRCAGAEARREALKPLYAQLILLLHKLSGWCGDLVRDAVDQIARRTYPEALRDQVAKCVGVMREKIELVAIGKKGRRSAEERQRESDPLFRHAQRFRAGVEGTISYLKRVLGLARCYLKGWTHYAAAVGAAVFVHNLMVLIRA